MVEPPSGDAAANETEPMSESSLGAAGAGSAGETHRALLIYYRTDAQVVLLSTGRPVTIGREAPSNVLIREKSLSREHARFTLLESEVHIEDLDSRNGTWVKGRRVRAAVAHPGDEIRLGTIAVSVHATHPSEIGALELEGHDSFRLALEDEIGQAKKAGRSFALLMVRAADGPDAHVSRFRGAVRKLLRAVDRTGLYSPEMLEIMLPNTAPTLAMELAKSIAERRGDGGRQLLVGVAIFPGSGATADALIDCCHAAVLRTSGESAVQSSRMDAWVRESAADADVPSSQPVVVSRAMRAVFAQIDRLAQSSIPVLLLGETGTGKEVVARLIHERGPRRGRGIVYVNCGAIAASLTESVLFGYERGAFTGASQTQKGIFEAAHGGTLLLDEIGELPLQAQAALLRVLGEKQVTRVGSTKIIDVDVRVIAATNRDLEAMCAQKKFRDDLFYRLNTMTLLLPPLRERVEEIEPLARQLLACANASNNRRVRRIRPQAMEFLRAYSWPGNVRELRNIIERAVVIAQGDEITEQELPERVRAVAAAPAQVRPAAGPAELDAPAVAGAAEMKARLQDYEAKMILEALRASGGNQSEAARRTGIPLRTLVRKIAALDLKSKI